VQAVLDDSGKELTAAQLWRIFELEYRLADDGAAASVSRISITDQGEHGVLVHADARIGGDLISIGGKGSGPIDGFVAGLNEHLESGVRVLDYHEHSIASGADARAVAYLELRVGASETVFGVGIDANIVAASLKAIASGLARAKSVALRRAASPVTA